MYRSGMAHMGIGSASGKDKAENAAKMAISSPLLDTSIKGATGIILSITASPDVGLADVDVAATMVTNECNPDASVIFGVAFDPELEDEMRITIIATGFTKEINGNASVKVETKAEAAAETPKKEEKTAAEAESAPAPEAPKTAPKKSQDLNLDDFWGSMFGN
jgi:cell division protein FtsZ